MQKTKFSLYSDCIFYAFCAFCLTFFLLRFYKLPLWVCLSLSLLLFAFIFIVCYLISSGKYDRKILTKKEEEEKNKLMLHLALEKRERVRATLLSAYLKEKKEAHCEQDELLVEGKALCFFFTLDELNADAVASLIRKYSKDFTLLCNLLSIEARKLLLSFSIPFVEGKEVYALLKKTECIPSPLICGEIERKSVRQKLKRGFSKKNARPFLTCGLLLLIMSLFVLFPVYYIVLGSVLLLCAVTVKLFGYAN